jgi:hypothetical protein
MMNLTFDILAASWNKIKVGSAIALQNKVPGLVNPRAIMIQRMADDRDSFTVIFRGFDQALESVDQSSLLKRVILEWLQKFANLQIERGDMNSFIVKIYKDSNIRLETPSRLPQTETVTPHLHNSTNITRIVEVDEKISKELAAYRGHPVNGEECNACRMFNSPNTCSLVEGKIYSHGYCQYFSREG